LKPFSCRVVFAKTGSGQAQRMTIERQDRNVRARRVRLHVEQRRGGILQHCVDELKPTWRRRHPAAAAAAAARERGRGVTCRAAVYVRTWFRKQYDIRSNKTKFNPIKQQVQTHLARGRLRVLGLACRSRGRRTPLSGSCWTRRTSAGTARLPSFQDQVVPCSDRFA
jgi:hypothetical protein